MFAFQGVIHVRKSKISSVAPSAVRKKSVTLGVQVTTVPLKIPEANTPLEFSL